MQTPIYISQAVILYMTLNPFNAQMLISWPSNVQQSVGIPTLATCSIFQ